MEYLILGKVSIQFTILNTLLEVLVHVVLHRVCGEGQAYRLAYPSVFTSHGNLHLCGVEFTLLAFTHLEWNYMRHVYIHVHEVHVYMCILLCL